MKNLLLIIFAFTFSQNVTAQNVAINNDGSAANASAALDIKSTDKGMLVPRMTTAQRTIIASPATGLLVFDTTTGSFWFYNGATWAELAGGGGVNYWSGAGNDIYTINNGNAGIGISTPAEKLSIRGNLGLYSGTTRYGFMDYNNAKWRMNAKLGGIGFTADDIILQHTYQQFTTSGKVGIGTDTPTEKLDVNGNINLSGKLNSTLTGTANLIPIAYGKVNANGTIASGTGNFTIFYDPTYPGHYRISVPGYTSSNAVLVANIEFDANNTFNPHTIFTYAGSLGFSIQIYNHIPSYTQCGDCNPPSSSVLTGLERTGLASDFYFVIYKQ